MTNDCSKRTSGRIERIKTDVMKRAGSFVKDVNPFIRSVARWRASHHGRSMVQIRAGYLHELVKLAPLTIGPDWRLAGNHLPTAHMEVEIPDPSDPAHVRQLQELGVPAQRIDDVRNAVTERRSAYAVGQVYEKSTGGISARRDSLSVFWDYSWRENHSIRDYAKVLRMGFCGVRGEVEQQLRNADIADPDFPRKENFRQAALSICDAGILLGRRYAQLAAALAEKATSPEERARLTGISERCSRVPAHGARTFLEATQSLWLSHILTCGEDGINANSLGRLDQILYPYYKADIEAGRITREVAVEIMEELACRLYLEYDVQAITLGGVDNNGNDAVNDLSYVFLEATRNVGFIRDLSIRLHRDSPRRFVDAAAELITRGGGIPFIFNDDCFIPALTDRGIALEDARDYAPIGCVELTVPGRANPHAVSGMFSSIKCLELALFDGKDPLSGRQLGPHTGMLGDFSTFDDLFRAYCCQVEYFARQMVYCCNRGELLQRELGPLPCWSVLTDHCIQRGRDITDGGAAYNYHSICFIGTANTADSMMALKKLVFEENVVSPDELLDALRSNFDGHEALRRKLLKQAPKYGNDCPEVDHIAARIANHFIDLMDTMRSPLDGRYFVHLFSFLWNIDFGKGVGATPDGRKAGEPLAYSVSPQQGRDRQGVTAMLNSLARLPHKRAAGSSAAIIEIDPLLVEGDSGAKIMSDLIQAAIVMGVGQMQWNVTTAERLKKAQDDPERYGNVAVRVAGYSQMFKLVDKELQDHIIARTKHRR